MSQRGRSSTSRDSAHVRWADEEQIAQFSVQLAEIRRRLSSSSATSRIAFQGSVSASSVLPVDNHTVSLDINAQDAEATSQPKDDEPQARGLPTEEPRSQEPNAKGPMVSEKDLRDLRDLDWHILSVHEVAQKLCTSTSHGLFEDQAASRYLEFGKNSPLPLKINPIRAVLVYVFKSLAKVLLLGGLLAFISWKPFDHKPSPTNLVLCTILVVGFLFHVGFSIYQDFFACKSTYPLKRMLTEECEVARSGETMRIPASALVPGDLVTIKAGDNLPADLRFTSVSSNARIDRSLLTGDSVPMATSVNLTDTNYLETRNIGLQGTHCLAGSCTGMVVATGHRTVLGRIATLTNESRARRTPMERDLSRLMLIMFLLMCFFIGLLPYFWGTWLKHDYPGWISVPALIVNCLTMAVAFIPEGLPIAITLGLAIVARRMENNFVLCKSLKHVETLGSVSVICSDKTGTLTEGKMAVVSCCFGANTMTVAEAQQRIIPEMAKAIAHNVTSVVGQIGAISALCNAAEMETAPDDAHMAPSKMKILGDATDIAILRFSEELKIGNVSYFRSCWRKVYELAFDSKNKFMICCFSNTRPEAVKHTMPEEAAEAFGPNDLLLTIKGAPDILIGRCSHYLTNEGAVAPLDADALAAFEATQNALASQGQRCLILAQKTVHRIIHEEESGDSELEEAMMQEAEAGLLLVGLVALVDPLRPEIQGVVSVLRDAGIKIAMVTGDSALTALAVARDAGIVTSAHVENSASLRRTPDNLTPEESEQSSIGAKEAIVISGPEILHLSFTQWMELTEYKEIVFARVTPEQKALIVRAFQIEELVAMVGDGTNDAPSLKTADIGIAVGRESEIASEAADMILLDNFTSIIPALYYGRVVFENLKKAIAYMIPAGSFAQCWPVLISFSFGLPQILSPILMVVICCLTDLSAAIALSYEKAETNILLRPPRNTRKDRLVSLGILIHGFSFVGVVETFTSYAMSIWYLNRNGIPFGTIWMSYGLLPDNIDLAHFHATLKTAASIYFVTLVVMQWFNLMATRTSRLSIFQHPPMFNKYSQNWKILAAILFSLGTTLFILYFPPLQRSIGICGVPVEHWFLPFAFGLLIMFLDETRRFCIRRWPWSWFASLAF